jgi:hypothetical protein
MSETIPPPPDVGIASGTPSPIASVVSTTEHSDSSALALPPPPVPPETHAMIELIGRGLDSEADEPTRAAARELWARFAQVIAGAAPAPGMPVPTMPIPAMPIPAMPIPGMPVPPMPTPPMPTPPMPTSPIAMAARALRQLPPDQLLDLVLQRLRAALPAGASVPTPKAIQFQLVPVTPPSPR